MRTPIVDYIENYCASGTARLHMPGHKGQPFLGFESMDITEIRGADALYEADGIIAESEQNASALFGTRKTCFSTEGSSQCVKAMLYLALVCRPKNAQPRILAARNVHRSFVHGAALLDLSVQWLWPQQNLGLCGCEITPEMLEKQLSAMDGLPAAVYVTSPDYLGNVADVRGLAAVCHRFGTHLLVDNAHGAYLHFLENPTHPMDLGADLCCDSAHKTLPVLTGGAYLHVGRQAPKSFAENAKQALALFGSTSPSYLILASLDRCNRYLAQNYTRRLQQTVQRLEQLREALHQNGWQTGKTDPLRLTVEAPTGTDGLALAECLRRHGGECEYADPDYLVTMLTPESQASDLRCLEQALEKNHLAYTPRAPLPLACGEAVYTMRQAIFLPHETVPAQSSLHRICAATTVACPPAVPVVVSGERITAEALQLFRYYNVETVDVVLE